MTTPAEKLLKWVPVVVLAAGVVATAAVDGYRLNLHAEELIDISESVDENEEAIEAIDRALIERRGAVEVRTQRIEIEQKQQSEKLDEAIILLQRLLQNQGGN